MGVHIHIHTQDGAWEESKHPRRDDGKFGSGGARSARIDTSTPAGQRLASGLLRQAAASNPSQAAPQGRMSPEERRAMQRAQIQGDKDKEAEALSELKKHPMYAKEDFEYLRDKGYSAAEIRALWDRDHKAGKAPLHANKNSKSNQAELNLIRHAMAGNPYGKK